MSSFHAVIETLAPADEGFEIDAPEEWGQGRTLYGGMTAALAYEATRRAHGDLGPLRSAQFTFIGPAAGRLRFQSTLLRRGRSSAIVGAECYSEGAHAARATFVFGGARESKIAHDFLPLPNVSPPQECERFEKWISPNARGFFLNYERRIAAGSRLLEPDAPRPEFSVWTRFLDAGPADPIAALLAIADCLPPAAMVHFPQSAPISTMTWTVDLLTQPKRADGWFLLRSSSEHAGDGYSMQTMMLWDESGAPLAVGRQAVAIFA